MVPQIWAYCPGPTWVVALLLCVASQSRPISLGQEKDRKKSSAVKVEGRRLSFDPKTCTEGYGHVFFFSGSFAVQVIGHKDGQCRFEFTYEIEGGYTVYLGQVPVNGGLVTIDAQGPLETSFPWKSLTILRGYSFFSDWQWLPLLGAEGKVNDLEAKEMVSFRDKAVGKGAPPKPGDIIRVRLRFPEKLNGKDVARQNHEQEFVFGGRGEWKWLHTAVAEMRPGSTREVRISSDIAEGLKDLLPKFDPEWPIDMELELLSVSLPKERQLILPPCADRPGLTRRCSRPRPILRFRVR
jgi:hypothetical protein